MKIRRRHGNKVGHVGSFVLIQAGAHKAEIGPERTTEGGLWRFARQIAIMLKRWHHRKPFSGSVKITGPVGSVSLARRSDFRAFVNDIFRNLFNVVSLTA